MARKFKVVFAGLVLLVSGFLGIAFTLLSVPVETEDLRAPASIPNNYDARSACEKQEILWDQIQKTMHRELPDFPSFGISEIWKMRQQGVRTKGHYQSDFAPEGWIKHLHRRGSVAKVKVVAKEHSYTGTFQGAACALLRLSLTYKPGEKRAVAPGLALKILRNGIPSANISALVSLYGQEADYNFFKHPMSNIVPAGSELGQKWVHRVFLQTTRYPEQLLASDLAKFDTQGSAVGNAKSPRQIFFVPNEKLQPSSEPHDVRADFAMIPEGTVIYRIHAVSPKHDAMNYAEYQQTDIASLLQDSEYIADVVTTSAFIASEFGDTGIFFRHEIRPPKPKK